MHHSNLQTGCVGLKETLPLRIPRQTMVEKRHCLWKAVQVVIKAKGQCKQISLSPRASMMRQGTILAMAAFLSNLEVF
jgi:hypothetical protein